MADKCVEAWLGRLSKATAFTNEYHFIRFMGWMAESGGEFSGYTPSMLVDYQAEAQGRDSYKILDLVQQYVNGVEGRHGYKVKIYSTLRSFFTHSRVELPRDSSYNIRGDRPRATGKLRPEEIRRVVLSSKGAYRAAFMCMLMGGMDLSGFDVWNQDGWESLKQTLDQGRDVHIIQLPGRKKYRNIRPYKTIIGKDALDAIREYLPERPQGTAIFYDQFRRPLSRRSLQLYWKRRLIGQGFIKLRGDGDPGNRYGKNLHELRDSFRTLWSMSGAAPHVAEAIMGHQWDPLGYDKSPDDEKYMVEQYRKAIPWLNLISSGRPFGQVSEDEVDRLRRELEEAKRSQSDELRSLTADMAIFKRVMANPETAPIFWKALKELEDKADR